MDTKMTQMRKMRDTELRKCFLERLAKAYKKAGCIDRRSIIMDTITNSKPYYYVTFDHALRVVHEMMKRETELKHPTLKQRMWLEITERTTYKMLERNMNVQEALLHVLLYEHASRFFISEKYAYNILYKLVHEKRPYNNFAA